MGERKPDHAEPVVGNEDDEDAVCLGCYRYWRPVNKSGYCDECEDAIREDIKDGKRSEGRLTRLVGNLNQEETR